MKEEITVERFAELMNTSVDTIAHLITLCYIPVRFSFELRTASFFWDIPYPQLTAIVPSVTVDEAEEIQKAVELHDYYTGGMPCN